MKSSIYSRFNFSRSKETWPTVTHWPIKVGLYSNDTEIYYPFKNPLKCPIKEYTRRSKVRIWFLGKKQQLWQRMCYWNTDLSVVLWYDWSKGSSSSSSSLFSQRIQVRLHISTTHWIHTGINGKESRKSNAYLAAYLGRTKKYTQKNARYMKHICLKNSFLSCFCP